LADKIREEEELEEARRRAVELQRQADEAAAAAAAAAEEAATLMEVDGDDEKETIAQNKPAVVEVDNAASFANGAHIGECEHLFTSLSHLPCCCFIFFYNIMFLFHLLC
jgi:RNA-binding protein 25